MSTMRPPASVSKYRRPQPERSWSAQGKIKFPKLPVKSLSFWGFTLFEVVLIGFGLTMLLLSQTELFSDSDRREVLGEYAAEPVFVQTDSSRWKIDDLPLCHVNPSSYFEKAAVWVPECEDPTLVAQPMEAMWPSRAYVLNLKGSDEQYTLRKRFLHKHNIDLRRFEAVNGKERFGAEYFSENIDGSNVLAMKRDGKVIRKGESGFLTAGERGYLASMLEVLAEVESDASLTSVMVIDDDALFTCSFEDDLKKLLSDTRCGVAGNPTAQIPGVLMLGSAVWIPGTYPMSGDYCGGWKLLEDDARMTTEATGHESRCINANSKTYGSYAVIYHRASIPSIREWINNATAPYDHMFADLPHRGVSVRLAWPYLAMQDVRHASQIDDSRKQQSNFFARAKLHRWDLKSFCDMKNFPLPEEPPHFNVDDVVVSLSGRRGVIVQPPASEDAVDEETVAVMFEGQIEIEMTLRGQLEHVLVSKEDP
eukprot:m.61522 g.61522  ORF g.61522 m.61522 type:complete len:480 (-) comp22998_c0_seq1:42-1481(-)